MNSKSVLCIIPLFLFPACSNESAGMPDSLRGCWKSVSHYPDVTIGSDSTGSYAVVHHRTTDRKDCPVRYPLRFVTRRTGFIQAEGRILFCYDSVKCSLFLSPGGYYTHDNQ